MQRLTKQLLSSMDLDTTVSSPMVKSSVLKLTGVPTGTASTACSWVRPTSMRRSSMGMDSFLWASVSTWGATVPMTPKRGGSVRTVTSLEGSMRLSTPPTLVKRS